VGRGGWTWYTGTAGWVYKAGLESILGFGKSADQLTIDPCIPKKWPGYSMEYRYRNTDYRITVKNPKSVNKGVTSVSMDGKSISGNVIDLTDDGNAHHVEVILG
jgi:cellobiose phosphorylase